MSRYNLEPLESFRLNRCQIPTTCHICDHDNLFDADRCRTCFAPLSLARSHASQPNDPKRAPILVPTFGTQHSGKTVFMGLLLDILSRQREQMEFATCDAASVAMQQDSVAALARYEFPPSTDEAPENWRWAHCRLKRRARKEPLELFMVDVSGRAILRELESLATFPVMRGLFTKSHGMIICADTVEVRRGDKDQEFFAMRIINHVLETRERAANAKQSKAKKRRGKPIRENVTVPPIAVVLTKGDEHDSIFLDVRTFVSSYMPGLWELTQSLESEIEFFPVSAVAQTAVRRSNTGTPTAVPLRIEPRGIIEPFRWLMGRQHIA